MKDGGDRVRAKVLDAIAVAVARAHEFTGPVRCPRCGWKIRQADSPAIVYIRCCSGYDRLIAIEIHDDILQNSVGDEVLEHS